MRGNLLLQVISIDCRCVWVHLVFAKDTNVNFVLQAVCQVCVLLVLSEKCPDSFLELIFGMRYVSIHSTWALVCYFMSVSEQCRQLLNQGIFRPKIIIIIVIMELGNLKASATRATVRPFGGDRCIHLCYEDLFTCRASEICRCSSSQFISL